VRSKAGKSQLNLPHGTKTKPDRRMQKNSEQPESVVSVREKEWGPIWWEGFVKEVLCTWKKSAILCLYW